MLSCYKALLLFHLQLEKLESTKALTSRLIGGGKEVIHMREVVIRLMKKCEKISKEMGDLASYLVNAADFEEDGKSVPEMKITKQPPILNPRLVFSFVFHRNTRTHAFL